MRCREQWAELGTGAKLLIGLGVVVTAIPVFGILAAIVAALVLGMGDGAEAAPTPQADWGYNYTQANDTSGELTITHRGGNTIEASALQLEIGDSSVDWGTDGAVHAGVSTTVTFSSDARLRLVRTGGDADSVIATWDGPDA